MTARKRIPPPAELEAAGLRLIEDRGWTTVTLRHAGRDPRLRRAALAELVVAAYYAKHPTAAQRELMQTVRLWSQYQRYVIHREFFELGEFMCSLRQSHENPPEPVKRMTPRPLWPDDAARLMAMVHGTRPQPRTDHRAIVDQAAQTGARNFAGDIPTLARLALAGLDTQRGGEPTADEREIHRWASAVVAADDPADPAIDDLRLDAAAQAADGVDGLALIRQTRRRGLMPAVVDAVRQRMNTDTHPKENP